MRRGSGQLLRAFVALVGLGGGVGGCSGMLVIPDTGGVYGSCADSSECEDKYICGTNGKCIESLYRCSEEHTDGDCGTGFCCVGGACIPSSPTTGCQIARCDVPVPTLICGADEACGIDGQCHGDLPACPPDPNGACDNGGDCCENGSKCCDPAEMCQAGHCIPKQFTCSEQYPNGYCQTGYYCSGGRCVLIPVPCDPAHPTGQCADSTERCVAGSCQPAPCDTVGRPGVCPADFVCDLNLGQCVPLACSRDHTGGACTSSTQKCSHIGTCIDKGTCAVGADCQFEQFCSSSSHTCMTNGACDTDPDCQVEQAATYGQAYVCTSTQCVARYYPCDNDTAPCVATQKCSSDHFCLTPPACHGPLDCDAGHYCGTGGTCLADTTCVVTADCLLLQANTVCGGNIGSPKQCYPRGQCFRDTLSTDCPPNNDCNGGTGTTPGTCTPRNVGECDSNTFTDVGCAPGHLTCCAAGGTCCSSGVCNLSQHNCVPAGQCVADTDCLSGTHCVDYWCVPINTNCATCNATTEQCAAWTVASGVPVAGCIPKGRCINRNQCALGEVCTPDHTCVAGENCGYEAMAVGGAVQPNVLVVVDRSGSMDLCGPANAPLSNCGYLSGTCTASYCVGGTDNGKQCKLPDDCVGGGYCGNGECRSDEFCYNTATTCTAGTTSGTCVGGSNPGVACDIAGSTCTGGTCTAKSCASAATCGTGGVCGPKPNGGQCWNPYCTYGMCTIDGACASDATCPSGDVCYFTGKCSAGPAVGAVCGSASDCPDPANSGTCSPALKCVGGLHAGASCVTNADCGNYFACNASTCTGGANATQPCSLATDCPGGTCTPPATGQGFCTSPTCITPRWSQARSAIAYVTDNYKSRINFGLSIFPEPHRPCTTSYDCGIANSLNVCNNPTGKLMAGECTDLCTQTCRFKTCMGNDSVQPGVVEVPIAPGADQNAQQSAMLAAIDGTDPGGSTPTASTLRGIFGRADRGGLAAADRANAVLLVTDGEATGDMGTVKVCSPPCADVLKNGDETDVDCGGSCGPCATGKSCVVADDCSSRICRVGVCRAASCANDARDGDETDVDCGGTCGPCTDGKGCAGAADCASKICDNSACTAAACTDGQKNGDETDVDCGGKCATAATVSKCADNKGCTVAADCVNGVCQAGLCRPGSCADTLKSTGETDVDCGGTSCGPCLGGQACAANTDCQSGECNLTKGWCESPSCTDQRKDGNETAVDCGGTDCGACAAGLACVENADCQTRVCGSNKLCAVANCGDGVRNGDETGIDCGGVCATCGGAGLSAPACAGATPAVTANRACTPFGYNTTCTADGDCASKACVRGYCSAPCKVDADCGSPATCQRGYCGAAHCTDGSMNSAETGVDCGGPECPPCYSCGSACPNNNGTCHTPDSYGDSDCLSGRCNGGTCGNPNCSDSVKNGIETDVDCGGSCAGCAAGKSCNADTDCASGLCETGRCQAARCGGSLATKCKPFQTCAAPGDCVGGNCKDYTDLTGYNATKQPDLVNAAIGHLYGSTPKVKTFVIGFNLGATSKNLNCHAVYGRTARRDQGSCATRTAADCASEIEKCYYDANDQTSLQTAFQDIVKAVASCTYDLSATTVGSWPNGYFVYLLEGTTRTRVDQFSSWTVQNNRLEFFGTACTKIQSGVAAPLVIRRCPEGG